MPGMEKPFSPGAIQGAFWFDQVLDIDDVPLVTVPQQQDWFDVFLHPSTAPTSTVASQAASQHLDERGAAGAGEGPEGEGPDAAPAEEEEEGPKPKPKPKKKKSLSRAEKARIEREKNREIQARYRARQKEKKAALAADYETAEADLERERDEHELLRQENDVLERILQVRDEEVAALENAASKDPPRSEELPWYDPEQGSFWAPLPEGWDARHGEQALGLGQGGVAAATFTELSGSKSEGAPTPSGSSASAGSAGGGVSIGPGGAGASSSSPGGRGSAGGREAGDGAVEDCPQLRMAAQGPREAARTGDGRMRYQVPWEVIEKAKNMSPNEYFKNWEEFAGRLKDMIAQYDLTHSHQALEELEPLLKRRAIIMTLMLHHNTECVKALFSRSGEQGRSEEEQHEYWAALVASMCISLPQRERFQHLWDSYQHRVTRLRARRNDALSLMRQASSQENMLVFAHAGNLNGLMAQYLEVLESANTLRAYPDAEFMAVLELLSESGRILTPLQKARMACYSYPLFPDILQVMHAITRLPTQQLQHHHHQQQQHQ